MQHDASNVQPGFISNYAAVCSAVRDILLAVASPLSILIPSWISLVLIEDILILAAFVVNLM